MYKAGRNAEKLIIVFEESTGSHAASGFKQRQGNWTEMGHFLAAQRASGNYTVSEIKPLENCIPLGSKQFLKCIYFRENY
jgi:hypothetical protein